MAQAYPFHGRNDKSGALTHFFPEISPHSSGVLSVSDGHELYWERCGNPDGLPLLFLHGGPGSGTTPKYRRLFDPGRFDIILLDQRGAGRSHPHASLEANTTWHLVADIEALRAHLGVSQWLVFGPSWGSTLALAYAQTHPDRLSGLVVEAVFLGTAKELHWWHDQAGAPRFFPDAWEDFIAPVPAAARTSPGGVMDWYFAAMQAELEDKLPVLSALAEADIATLRQSPLYRWTEYEDRLSYLEYSPEDVLEGLRQRGAAFVASHSLIEAHYFRNQCFLEPDQLIRDTGKLAQIPMSILHSRYDMVCPPESAFRLAKACPHAEFTLVPVNGHGMTETVQAALNAMMQRLIARL